MNKSSEGRNPEEKSVPKWSSPPPPRHGGEREQGRGRRALAAHVEALSQRLVRQRFERPFSCRARGWARGQENGERGGGGAGTAGPRATKSRSHPRRAFSPGPNNAAVFARHVARVWIGSVAKQGRGILRRTFASEARARRRWRRRFASQGFHDFSGKNRGGPHEASVPKVLVGSPNGQTEKEFWELPIWLSG